MTVLTKQSIGRSADYVLHHYPNVIRIFIYAPKSFREKKVMEMYGDSPEAAKKSIAKSDAARSAYYKSISGQEWAIHTAMNCALTHRWARRLQQT